MVKHNQGSQRPQQNNGQTVFGALLHKTGISVFLSSMAGQRQHGLPEEGLLSLIEKK